MEGKKTYIIGALMAVYGLVGLIMKWMDPADATRLIMEGGGFAALRAGVAKV